LLSPRSKVEVGPTGARHYDLFMNVISLGYYPYLIRKVIDKMDIQPRHSILDLGSGTGRNDCFIARKIGPDGGILGLDISKEMLSLSRKHCQSYPNVNFREQRIEMPLTYQEEFDKVFISFVLHGFEDAQKGGIISNAYRALKPGGAFCILDYNEFDLERLWFPLRWAFIHGECQLASEFLKLDLKEMLSSQGFSSFEEELLLRGHLRLLKAAK
jgi:ubiquinone/menaquinone biosynthesis C-methylase UbiE